MKTAARPELLRMGFNVNFDGLNLVLQGNGKGVGKVGKWETYTAGVTIMCGRIFANQPGPGVTLSPSWS